MHGLLQKPKSNFVLTSHIVDRACNQHGQSDTKWHHFFDDEVLFPAPILRFFCFPFHLLHLALKGSILFFFFPPSDLHFPDTDSQLGKPCRPKWH